MIKLTKEQVVSIHSSLIKASGGTDGVRDDGLLESALESPFQTFDGHDLIRQLYRKRRESDIRWFQIIRLSTEIRE
ncbi:MAG: hypothetical protein ACLS48_07520 [[Eubacterium] siraeum]